jgi:hypothetical protein
LHSEVADASPAANKGKPKGKAKPKKKKATPKDADGTPAVLDDGQLFH